MANTTTLQEFKQSIMGSASNAGIVSPARFEVMIFGNATDTRELVLTCDTAFIPGINLLTREARTYGPLWEVPYAKTFDNLELTFILKKSFHQRFFFEEWYSKIIDFSTNNAYYYSEMVRNVDIKQFDQQGNTIYHCSLINAYPKRLDMIPLSWAANDEFEKVSVNLTFENIRVNMYENNMGETFPNKMRDYDHLDKTSSFRGY